MKTRLAAALLGLPVAGYAVLTLVAGRAGPVDDGPFLEGAPVRATADGADGVFVLTSMWRTTSTSRGRFASSPVQSTVQYVDLWRFDPATARPVWRRRIARDPKGVRSGFRVLGVAGGKLWYWARGLRAASLADGRTLLDTAALFAKAPDLRTTMPTDMRHLRLDTLGLHLRGADGRGWRIDPRTLAVREEPAREPWEDAYTAQFRGRVVAAEARTGLALPAVVYPASPQGYKMANLWRPGRWAGITTDARGDSLRAKDPADPALAQRSDGYQTDFLFSDDYLPEERLRLWSARLVGDPRDRVVLRDLAPLPKAEPFLQAGLLHDASKRAGAYRPEPLVLADPDGVLLLARSRLDEADTLVLARADLADGATRWRTRIPLSLVKAVMPGTPLLVLHGQRFRPRRDDMPRDPTNDAHEALVFVDVRTGAVRHWMLDLDHGKVEPLDDAPVAVVPDSGPRRAARAVSATARR